MTLDSFFRQRRRKPGVSFSFLGKTQGSHRDWAGPTVHSGLRTLVHIPQPSVHPASGGSSVLPAAEHTADFPATTTPGREFCSVSKASYPTHKVRPPTTPLTHQQVHRDVKATEETHPTPLFRRHLMSECRSYDSPRRQSRKVASLCLLW